VVGIISPEMSLLVRKKRRKPKQWTGLPMASPDISSGSIDGTRFFDREDFAF
jgi:hypothetical protein